MAVIYCPNCGSAVSSRERRCWICDKALAPPAPAPRNGSPTYPQRMRLVRMEETTGGLTDGFRCRIVYLKSIEDGAPVRDYWQPARDQRLPKVRKACAAVAALLAVLLIVLLAVFAVPVSQTVATSPARTADTIESPRLAPPAPPAIVANPQAADSTAFVPMTTHGDLGLTANAPASWGGDD